MQAWVSIIFPDGRFVCSRNGHVTLEATAGPGCAWAVSGSSAVKTFQDDEKHYLCALVEVVEEENLYYIRI
jgi:hypothetical protein